MTTHHIAVITLQKFFLSIVSGESLIVIHLWINVINLYSRSRARIAKNPVYDSTAFISLSSLVTADIAFHKAEFVDPS